MSTHYNAGDAIEGKRVACQFRDMGRIIVGKGTHKHRAQMTTLYIAFCIIEEPLIKA